MSLLMKDPQAVLDYAIDWSAEYLGEDSLAESGWTVEPDEPGGVVVDGSDFDSGVATVKASGGIAGRLYKLINQVTMASGRIDQRSIVLRVEQR
jgi:hypothetical protein